ncbi:hypothetical protein CHUAL_009742 [Chamberlinius hualienensis]
MALQVLNRSVHLKNLSGLLRNSAVSGRRPSYLISNNDHKRNQFMPHDPDNPIDDSNTGQPNPKYPFRRAAKIIANDFKNMAKGKFYVRDDEVFPSYCDVVIIGGGIIGSSIAYFLKQRTGMELEVVVLEKDPTYAIASTTLSVGGIRQQFSIPENIQMSMYGYEFLRDVKKHLSVDDMDPPEVNFCPNGYLFLASEAGEEALQENHRTQIELGAKVELLSPIKLKEKFGWLNVDDIALGNYGYSQEGWFDPHSLLMAFKMKALSLGVRYLPAEVIGFKTRSLRGSTVVKQDDVEVARIFEKLNKIVVHLEDMNEIREIQTCTVIIAGGAMSGRLGQMAGIGSGTGFLKTPIPVEPRKRYTYVLDCPTGPGLSCPLVVDPSGAYFRKDGLGSQYICGKSPSNGEEEPDISNLDVDYGYFDNTLWPILANRVPNFEKLKLKSAYAGYYDYNTFDQNAIIGQHPYFHNMFIATGFSGHGLQQAPAVGRAMMELIVDGNFKTINLEAFSFFRLMENSPLYERGIV